MKSHGSSTSLSGPCSAVFRADRLQAEPYGLDRAPSARPPRTGHGPGRPGPSQKWPTGSSGRAEEPPRAGRGLGGAARPYLLCPPPPPPCRSAAPPLWRRRWASREMEARGGGGPVQGDKMAAGRFGREAPSGDKSLGRCCILSGESRVAWVRCVVSVCVPGRCCFSPSLPQPRSTRAWLAVRHFKMVNLLLPLKSEPFPGALHPDVCTSPSVIACKHQPSVVRLCRVLGR